MAAACHVHKVRDARHREQVHEHRQAKDKDKCERHGSAYGKQPKQCHRLQHKRHKQRLHAKARIDPSAQDVRDQAEHAVGHKRGTGFDRAHAQHLLKIRRHVAVEHIDRAHAKQKDKHAGDDTRLAQQTRLLAKGGGLVGLPSARHKRHERSADQNGKGQRAVHGHVPIECVGHKLANRGHKDHRHGKRAVHDRDGK